jgi:hypothetical protein
MDKWHKSQQTVPDKSYTIKWFTTFVRPLHFLDILNLLKGEFKLNYSQRFTSYRAINTFRLGYKNSKLKTDGEIVAVSSEIKIKHTNTMCG